MSKIVLTAARDIALDKLVTSEANVRRIKAGVSIEELAEDIARRGLLQSLSVRLIPGEDGEETGKFSVNAGGRRLAALKLLVKQKRLARNAPVPCIVKTDGIEEEDSLAENTMREALHPLDQFRAFKNLQDQGVTIDEIAARFFVSPQVVRQRLKLAAASPKLLELYVAEEMSLEQLAAFCVTEDHARQEAVWDALTHAYNKEPHTIRRMLTEGAVKNSDRRAIFVGVESYEAAGGVVLRDLFSNDNGGWLQDVALLDKLAREKLAHEAERIRADGWKWSEVSIDFPYGHTNGLRRLPVNYEPLSERLVTELTTHRTLALRDALANEPTVAFQAMLHALCLGAFYHHTSHSCLEITAKSQGFGAQAPGLAETASARTIDARHDQWAKQLPEEPADLWDVLTRLDDDGRSALFAHCASLSVNVVKESWNRRPDALQHGDQLARDVKLDMVAAGWTPTVENYLGRVPKVRIVEAVREAKGEKSARLIEPLKKADMAQEAERLLAGAGWLPEPLRLAPIEATEDAAAGEAGEVEALPDFLAEDDGDTPTDAEEEQPHATAAE